MKQLEITLRARNNLLIQRRLDLGLGTQTAAARAIGMTVQEYNGYETFRICPMGKKGWLQAARLIAEFHGCSPDELWPEELRDVKQRTLTLYNDVAELTTGSASLALPPDVKMDYGELRTVVEERLGCLSPRDARVVRMRFGFDPFDHDHTFDEIGSVLGITVSRVGYLLNRSLARLRRYDLRSALDDWDDMGLEVHDSLIS